jgi:hypothetical protein
MSGLPRFFKPQRPRSFELKPRYYDERKEKLQQLIDRHDGSESKEGYRARLRHEFMRHRRVRADRNANIRVLLIIGVLLLIVYFLYL